ncbi:phage tail assembly chaperone [Rhizobium halophytocola]|uniref:Phage protein (TIGR02216 family) n=1 Tax=Rhizobium halophytocola TaxID=735519 RepID=A0ABS4DYY8_9HYPH|nr:putative phage protein (TIGR02216 family) [Rhizobium halophytocola]
MSRGPAAGASERETIPWDAMLHAGLSLLRLEPKKFWTLTLPEFVALTGGLAGRGERFGRTRLAALMARYPDG